MFSFQVRYCTGAFCFGMVFDVKLRLLFNYMTYTYSKANSHSGVLTPGVTRFLSRWMGHVVEPSNLMSSKSIRLLLDTKRPKENTKLLGSVGHTPGENPKIHIFAIRITNERIKLTIFQLFLTSLFMQHHSIIFIVITAECIHVIRVMNNLIEQRNINM